MTKEFKSEFVNVGDVLPKTGWSRGEITDVRVVRLTKTLIITESVKTGIEYRFYRKSGVERSDWVRDSIKLADGSWPSNGV